MLMKFVLSLVAPIAKFIGAVKAPTPQIETDDFYILKSLIKNGDCLLSRTSWQLSNLFMPGQWKHAAVYIDGMVYEASSKHGVQKISLEEFFYKKDFIGLCRHAVMEEDLMSVGRGFLDSKVGQAYDWDLYLSDNNKYYCSELVYYFNAMCFGLEFEKNFKPSKYLGKIVIRPTDLWLNMQRIGEWS